MHFREVIRRVLDQHRDGVDIAGGVNAVISVNDREDGAATSASSHQRIVQRDGETVIHEEEIRYE